MKAFLKFNRSDSFSKVCLLHWLEVFQEYEIFIVCDLFDVNKDMIPDYLQILTQGKTVKFINTDYSLGNEYAPMCKSRKRAMASANLVCFKHISPKDESFWIIDADDTMFLTKDYSYLKDRLKSAEQYLRDNSLDAFSLDFYREYNDTWTFGVCLMSSKINWQQIKSITGDDILKYNISLNCDSIFDILGRKGIFKLKNFVFNGMAFQHLVNNFRKMNVGVYYWNDKKLWDMPLKDDVVVL